MLGRRTAVADPLLFGAPLGRGGQEGVECSGDHLGTVRFSCSGALFGDGGATPVGEGFHDREFPFGRADTYWQRCVLGGPARCFAEGEQVTGFRPGPPVEDERGQLVGVGAQGVQDQGGVARSVGAGPLEPFDDGTRDTQDGRGNQVGCGVVWVDIESRHVSWLVSRAGVLPGSRRGLRRRARAAWSRCGGSGGRAGVGWGLADGAVVGCGGVGEGGRKVLVECCGGAEFGVAWRWGLSCAAGAAFVQLADAAEVVTHGSPSGCR